MKTGWLRFLCGLVPVLGATVVLALPSVPPSATHDPNGNRTKYMYPVTNRTLLSRYDATNRLDRITDGPRVSTYAYDRAGNRITCTLPNGLLTTTESGATKYFRYDGGDSFHEVANGAGNIRVEFARGSGMGSGIGVILCSDRSTPQEHFTYNAIGHTVAVTLQCGAISKTDLYVAFGRIVTWAVCFLDMWCDRTQRSRIKPMEKVACMRRAHEELILSWFRIKGEITNGTTKGLNNKIRVITRKTHDFRTLSHHGTGSLNRLIIITLADYPNQNSPTDSAEEARIRTIFK